MNTYIKNKPSGELNFINLKTFIQDHFDNVPYILTVKDENYLQNMRDQTYPGIFADNKVIDCNLRVLDTHMPEYLFFIIKHSENNISIRQAIEQAVKVGLPHYPKEYQLRLFELKMFNFFEAIIASNFSNNVWRGQWVRDNCYVTKRNGELEYYTVYDYRGLAHSLLDWLTISSIKEESSNNETYRLYCKLTQ